VLSVIEGASLINMHLFGYPPIGLYAQYCRPTILTIGKSKKTRM